MHSMLQIVEQTFSINYKFNLQIHETPLKIKLAETDGYLKHEW